ncbi:MAG TPA: PLP-dependent aminotransferase family protein [Trebonia sp.]|nr:PLP-dependent aminotransferase family protein [Trebonia sp.]
MTVPISSEVALIGPQALADLLGRWPTADGPLYRLLAARIGRLADTGELPPGIRLPPERTLAATLAVSRNTVALAYQVLRDDGMAESRQGSGTRLMPHLITPAAAHRANGYFSGMLGDAVAIDLSIGAVDCAPAVAEALQSPRDVLGQRELSRLTVGTGYLPYGLPELRAAIAAMLTTAHSVPSSAAEVLVTTGAQQALELLVQSEVTPGQAVVTEDPTFPGFLDAVQRAGGRLVGVPPGDVARIADAVAAHRPALVYLIPSFHNPTGTLLPAAARLDIVELARRHPDVTVIDDLSMAELPLPPPPLVGRAPGSGAVGDGRPPPLAALAPGLPNLVTVGSFSKTYWGGLRTGYVRAPEGIITRLAAAKAAADLGSPPFQQAIVATLVRDRHDEILKYRADWAGDRYAAMASALSSHLPGWEWTPPAGGVTIWARLPGDADSSAFAQAALRRGVAVIPGRLLSVSERRSPWLRLAFVRPPAELVAAVHTLAAVQPAGRAEAELSGDRIPTRKLKTQ